MTPGWSPWKLSCLKRLPFFSGVAEPADRSPSEERRQKNPESVGWRGRSGGLKVLSLHVKPGLKPEAVLYFLTVRSHKFFLFCLSYFELLFCLLQPNALSCLPKPTTVSEGLHRPCLIISFMVGCFICKSLQRRASN